MIHLKYTLVYTIGEISNIGATSELSTPSSSSLSSPQTSACHQVCLCSSWMNQECHEDEYNATLKDLMVQLNVTKTKKLVVDLKKDLALVSPVSLRRSQYGYVGVHNDNKMDWTKNTDALYRNGNLIFKAPQTL